MKKYKHIALEVEAIMLPEATLVSFNFLNGKQTGTIPAGSWLIYLDGSPHLAMSDYQFRREYEEVEMSIQMPEQSYTMISKKDLQDLHDRIAALESEKETIREQNELCRDSNLLLKNEAFHVRKQMERVKEAYLGMLTALDHLNWDHCHGVEMVAISLGWIDEMDVRG